MHTAHDWIKMFPEQPRDARKDHNDNDNIKE